MIEMTDSAIEAVRNAMKVARGTVAGLRIVVQPGGCAGLKYIIGLVPERRPDDMVVECDGITVLIDAASGAHIAGTKVDFVEGVEKSGFSFENPNTAGQCACSKSFR